MAKKRKTEREYYLEHLIRSTQLGGYVTRIYDKYVEEFAKLAGSASYDPEKIFSFDDYPETKERVGRLMTKISGEVVAYINRGTRQYGNDIASAMRMPTPKNKVFWIPTG